MSHQVETMAWTGETPWHGLGVEVDPTLTPQEMLLAAGLDWTVSRRPISVPDHPSAKQAEGIITATDYAMLVRDSDNSIFGPCGKNYVPSQNQEVFEFFDRFVTAGDMTMETAGSLEGGRKVWGLASIKVGFTLPGGDEVRGYLLVQAPHIWGKAITIFFTPIRVVCANTLAAALGGSKSGFSMPHIQAFDVDVHRKAEEALGLARNQMDEFEDAAKVLTGVQYKESELDRFIASLFQTNLLDGDKPVDRAKFNRTCESVHEAIWMQPGSEMSEGSWWTALNGVTYHIDHKAGRDRDASLNSAWFGPRAALKRKAFNLALEYAEAA